MGFVRQLLNFRSVQSGHPSQHSLAAIFGMGPTSYTGVAVNDDTAMTYSAVFAAIRLLSWSTAMLPLLTYRRQERGKVRAEDHPLYPLLKEQANPEMTAFDFRSTLMSHAVGRGNGYAEIEWSKAGEPLALWPLNPAKMTPERVNGQLRYLYQLPDGTTANLPAWRIHHVRGLSGNGVVGYSPVRLAMQAIGLGLATEEFGSRFFGNGARPGLIVKHPGQLSDTAFKNLQKSFNAEHQGLSNSHRIKILEEGMDIETVGVPPEEAQFLETRKFQVTEIARWFNVPPHMIADMSGATFSNIEEQGVEFVTYSLGPWLTNVEQALARDLLTEPEKKVLLIEHLVDGLLRGRTSERYAAYQTALQGGWMSPNEVRERENMNPYEGGDTYLLPMNMAPAGTTDSTADSGGNGLRSHDTLDVLWKRLIEIEKRSGIEVHERDCTCAVCSGDPQGAQPGVSRETLPLKKNERRNQELGTERRKLMEAYIPLYEDVAARMVRRETQDLERAFDKFVRRRSVDDFFGWIIEYYADFEGVLATAFLPVMMSLAQLVGQAVAAELDETPTTPEEIGDFVEEYLDDFAEGYAASSKGQIQALQREAQAEDPNLFVEIFEEKLKERIEEWAEKKALKVALRQAFQAGNGLVVGNYTLKGVRELVWEASGENCPYCAKLDGTIISIDEFFITAGESISGDPGDAPMLVRGNKRHGPIHAGCNCTVVAGGRMSSAPVQAPTNDPYGPRKPKPVRGQSAGANAARKLRKLDPYPARLEYIEAMDRADLKLYQADLIRKDIRNADEGIFPDHIGNDAAAQADYRARLDAELDRAVQEQIEALDARDAAKLRQDKAYARAKAETKKLLGGGNYEMYPTIGRGIEGDPDERKRLEEARGWLSEFITSKTVTDQLTNFEIDVYSTVDRSFYSQLDKKIAMSVGADPVVYVHEMAHAIDLQNDKVKQAALDFFNRRTKGLSDEPLSNFGSGYDRSEMCKPDDFMDAYCGKVPTPLGATEIISMGVQYMYENPLRFATEDPEHFTLIYDLFRGE